jgi:hypothetical protein
MSTNGDQGRHTPRWVPFTAELLGFAAVLFSIMIFTQDALDTPISAALGSLTGGALYGGIMTFTVRKDTDQGTDSR